MLCSHEDERFWLEDGLRKRGEDGGNKISVASVPRRMFAWCQFVGAGGIWAARGRGNSMAMKTISGVASVT